mgnify:CR=1 FL=1
MPRSVVCDAGGVLVAAGALEGTLPADVEILALDWTAITVGRFLAVRYGGNPARVRAELGLALTAVDEWFPVRTLVADTLERSGLEEDDALDSWFALLLAEQLDVALFTASDEVDSARVQIIRPW